MVDPRTKQYHRDHLQLPFAIINLCFCPSLQRLLSVFYPQLTGPSYLLYATAAKPFALASSHVSPSPLVQCHKLSTTL
jgi:hypothetical protein